MNSDDSYQSEGMGAVCWAVLTIAAAFIFIAGVLFGLTWR